MKFAPNFLAVTVVAVKAAVDAGVDGLVLYRAFPTYLDQYGNLKAAGITMRDGLGAAPEPGTLLMLTIGPAIGVAVVGGRMARQMLRENKEVALSCTT